MLQYNCYEVTGSELYTCHNSCAVVAYAIHCSDIKKHLSHSDVLLRLSFRIANVKLLVTQAPWAWFSKMYKSIFSIVQELPSGDKISIATMDTLIQQRKYLLYESVSEKGASIHSICHFDVSSLNRILIDNKSSWV